MRTRLRPPGCAGPVGGRIFGPYRHPGGRSRSTVGGAVRVEHVRAFVALAEELNFRRAAARLFVSQPTLTAQIHQLERDLGSSVDRGPGGTTVSSAGERLLPVAREALRALDDLVDVAGGDTAPARAQRTADGSGSGSVPGGLGGRDVARTADLRGTAAGPRPGGRVAGLHDRPAGPGPGEVEALLLHGPVDEVGRRRVTTVGCVPVAVLVPTHHWLAERRASAVDDVVPHARAVPPPEMGAAFTGSGCSPTTAVTVRRGAARRRGDAGDGARGRPAGVRRLLALGHPRAALVRGGRAPPRRAPAGTPAGGHP